MSTLADEYIRLRADARGLGPEIKAEAERAGAGAGTSAGHHFGRTMIGAIKAAGIGLAIAGAFVGVKAIAFLKQATKDASDLNETVSKSQNIFPKTQATITAFANSAAGALGLSKQQALEGAATFGNFFNQIGIGEQKSANMSTKLIQLAADLGSFSNAEPAEVMASFVSATRGEYDSLQRFIPTVNAATISTEALRITHKKSAKDLTDADKALALYNISFRDAGKAQGDFARTADGLANQQRILKANFANLRAEVGAALLPVVVSFTQQLNSKLVPALFDLWAKHGPQVVAWLQTAADNVGPLVDRLAAFDWASFGADVQAAFAKLGPALADLKKSGTGVELADDLKVLGVVMSFLADHADTLAKALPYLAVGFALVKTAQLASNVAAAASPAIRIAEIFATRALIASNRQLAASLTTSTAVTRGAALAQTGEVAAQNAGVLARARAVVGMIAQRVAMVAVRAATLAWTAVQWLLNAALTANPIGLIIVGIAALIAVIILIATKTTWFQTIWKVVWGAIKAAALAVASWFTGTILPSLHQAWDQLAAVVRFVAGVWTAYLQAIRAVVMVVFRAIVVAVQVVVAGFQFYWNLAKAIVVGVWNFIGAFIRNAINGLIFVVGRVREIPTMFRNGFEAARSAVVDRVSAIIAFVKGIPGKILAAVGNLKDLLVDAGRHIIEGLLRGITNAFGRVKDKLAELTNLLPDWKGPPERDRRILFGAGRSIIDGLGRGMDSRVPAIRSLLGDLTGTIATTAAPGAAGAAAPALRLHPGDLRAMGEMIGHVVASSVTIGSHATMRTADLYARGG